MTKTKKKPNCNVCVIKRIYPAEVAMVQEVAKQQDRSLGKAAAILIREGYKSVKNSVSPASNTTKSPASVQVGG